MGDVILRCLDLFAGHGTASQPFRDRGWQVTTVEIDADFSPDIAADIQSWEPLFRPEHFDFIWASPPCTAFSVASGGRHFRRENAKRQRWYPDAPGRGHHRRRRGQVDQSGHIQDAIHGHVISDGVDAMARAEVPYELGATLAAAVEWHFLDGPLIHE